MVDAPFLVALNLTRRCNLRCAHCYLDAGPDRSAHGELRTDECTRIADEAERENVPDIRESALKKCKDGMLSIAEMNRVTQE